jgi:hypothetical protein
LVPTHLDHTVQHYSGPAARRLPEIHAGTIENHSHDFAWWKWGISEQQEWFYIRWNLKAYGGIILQLEVNKIV